MSRQTLAITLLFIASLLCWRYFTAQQDTTAVPLYYEPDFVAASLTSQDFDKQGQRAHRIFAERMEHYNQLDMTTFDKPEILLFSEHSDQPSWKITADEGVLNRGDNVILRNSVVILNLDDSPFIEKLLTSYMELDLSNNTILSDRLITLIGNSFFEQGIGLRGELDKREVTLLNNVQATYNNEAN